MKKYIFIMGLCATSLTTITSCKKESFENIYRDPSKVTETTIDKQFSGMIYKFRELVVPTYRNYFVTLRPTINRYTQATGWSNEANQLTPGAAAIEDRWNQYYGGLAQYRELEMLYKKSTDSEKLEKKIFMLAAKIFFYDQTQQIVDLHGDIPWSKAGMLSSNGGDYTTAYAAYDKADAIYTVMLDDLKAISTELNTITIPTTVTTTFKTQDIINGGNLDLWKKYCNSLRLRLLTRVSAVSNFSARATQEIAEIAANQNNLIIKNSDNIQIDVFNVATDINSIGFRDALESWNANIAGKLMIDHMNSNHDPRLPFIFEPGEKANGIYKGLDQSLTSSVQTDLISGSTNGGTISIYNRSTYSRNQKFPGILISAAEINYLLAEYYNKTGNSGAAKTAFENGIKESINMFYAIRNTSTDNTVTASNEPTAVEKDAYIALLGWDTSTNKISLIATQKWLHFNIIQPVELWSEIRRLNSPTFAFRVENSDLQKTAPVKWNLPSSEPTYNNANYNVVKDQDNVNTKLFWDIN